MGHIYTNVNLKLNSQYEIVMRKEIENCVQSCILVLVVSVAYCLLLMMLFCMKWENKQTNEDGNDRAHGVWIWKSKSKFVCNNDFEEETDLNMCIVYLFPFVDIHQSLCSIEKNCENLLLSFEHIRSSVFGNGAG